MNESAQTRHRLIAVARELFAQNGYDGTSVRAITTRARANLGAITYHFGSKRSLYEAVMEAVIAPARDRLEAALAVPGTALDRLDSVLRSFFDYLSENPDLPRFMMQQLMSPRPITKAAVRHVGANVGVLSSVIAAGQKEGTVRGGDPVLLALSIVAQPIYIAIAARLLRETAAIDPFDPRTRERVVDSVVRFVRAGLAAEPERTG